MAAGGKNGKERAEHEMDRANKIQAGAAVCSDCGSRHCRSYLYGTAASDEYQTMCSDFGIAHLRRLVVHWLDSQKYRFEPAFGGVLSVFGGPHQNRVCVSVVQFLFAYFIHLHLLKRN